MRNLWRSALSETGEEVLEEGIPMNMIHHTAKRTRGIGSIVMIVFGNRSRDEAVRHEAVILIEEPADGRDIPDDAAPHAPFCVGFRCFNGIADQIIAELILMVQPVMEFRAAWSLYFLSLGRLSPKRKVTLPRTQAAKASR